MTREEKLLLQDLCARLPYGVKAQYYGSEEEKEEYKRTFEPFYDVDEYGKFFKCDYGEHTIDTFDWLHANHFDYRGLIQKGLAISTEEFNPYNNQKLQEERILCGKARKRTNVYKLKLL